MQNKNIETILQDKKVLAIVAKTNSIDNTIFFTPQEFLLQASIQNRGLGESTIPHEHPSFKDCNERVAQEIIYVLSGKIEVGLYFEGKRHKAEP